MKRLRLAIGLLAIVAAIGAAFLAGAMAYKHRAQIRTLVKSAQPTEIIQTNLYLLRKEDIAVAAGGRDGGIAALGDGILLASRSGKTWFVDREKHLRPLALQFPVNVSEFEADPYNKDTVDQDRFGVKDILVRRGPSDIQLLVSHTHWNAEKDCYGLRVSVLDTNLEQVLSGGGEINGGWRTVYDTAPCRTLNLLKTGKRAVTLGAGGRLAAVSDAEVLLSVGGFGPESAAADDKDQASDADDPYGKTILIDVTTGSARIFSRGHRNPQGLATGPDSRIWLTEHGPKGGDELNLVIEGRDYGWPHVTYGTEYEMLVWPENPHQGRHDGYEKPMYVWVPSIGVSQVAIVEKEAFPYWKGDLLVTSLSAMTIYRVRVEDGRTIFAEPIPVGHRIRDIAETDSGTIVLKTDDDFLVFLEPVSSSSGEGAGSSAERGQIIATQCQGCHSFAEDGSNGIGPNLRGVVGRRVASLEGFNYSEALKSARLKATKGRWTPGDLRTFLKDPQSFAPGNSMQSTSKYSDAEIEDVIKYLESLD